MMIVESSFRAVSSVAVLLLLILVGYFCAARQWMDSGTAIFQQMVPSRFMRKFACRLRQT